VLRRSIDVRNPYVDPLNLVQVELLRRVRQQADEQAHAALRVTVNGIAAGLRNTG
jgi:phosphoenolpyruvate carboxylase